jgi:hypothetical protein
MCGDNGRATAALASRRGLIPWVGYGFKADLRRQA